MQDGQRAPQRTTRVRLVGVGPKQGSQGIALLRLPGDGQVCKQGNGFSCIKCDRRTVQPNTGGASKNSSRCAKCALLFQSRRTG